MQQKQLDQMPVDQLIELKGRIEKMIQARIKRERESLLHKLDAIRGYEAMIAKSQNGVPPVKGGNGKKSKKKRRARPAPKYKDPASGATWTGRGMHPRWMREAIQAGKSPNDFLIPTEH